MALKAGYKGVKKSFLDLISGLKIITDIGSGLDLTAGKLKVLEGAGMTLDENLAIIPFLGDGLDFDENGKIVVTSKGGIDYSYQEQDTGLLWVDGKHIYRKTFHFDKTDMDTCTTTESVAHFNPGIKKGDVDFIWIDEAASFVKTYAQLNETVISTPVNYATEAGKTIRTNIQTESNPTPDSPLHIYYKAVYNPASAYNYGVDVYISLLYTKSGENV